MWKTQQQRLVWVLGFPLVVISDFHHCKKKKKKLQALFAWTWHRYNNWQVNRAYSKYIPTSRSVSEVKFERLPRWCWRRLFWRRGGQLSRVKNRCSSFTLRYCYSVVPGNHILSLSLLCIYLFLFWGFFLCSKAVAGGKSFQNEAHRPIKTLEQVYCGLWLL